MWISTKVWSLLKDVIPVVISFTALLFVIFDRRPRLKFKARSQAWYHLKPNVNKDCTVFYGIVEVYNVSARANAIRDYQIYWKKSGSWEQMTIDRYTNIPQDGGKAEVYNHTPLVLPPYSGAEARVQGIVNVVIPPEMTIKVIVEDLFGKHYHVVVKAIS
jgi:hypothetical protein